MNRRLLAAGSLLILAAGCATNPVAGLERYLGGPVKAVTGKLGDPTRVVDMQDGTWHYQWVDRREHSAGISIAGVPLTEAAPRECIRIVITDADKRVIGLDYRGDC